MKWNFKWTKQCGTTIATAYLIPLATHPQLLRVPLRVNLVGEDWTTFVNLYTVDEDNKTEEVPMPCRLAAHSASLGLLGLLYLDTRGFTVCVLI